jgi:aminopeptidase
MFLTKAGISLLKVNLGIKRDERILIFTDIQKDSGEVTVGGETTDLKRNSFEKQKIKEFCYILQDLARSLAKEVLFYEYPETGMHGVEPPEGLWRKAFGDKTIDEIKKEGLLDKIIKKEVSPEALSIIEKVIKKHTKKAVNAVVALSKYSTSHTYFRDLLTRICKARYASMPLFDISMLEGPMNVDWKALEKRTRRIAKAFKGSEAVTITTPNGTEISFSIKGRPVYEDHGILTKPGSFGNLPAGEVFLAPLEGTAEGRLVIEWAPTRPLSSPLTFVVEKGFVKDIIGDEPLKEELLNRFKENPLNANIAELGIGTNDRAKRPDNILESEKILGTIHIALGDNSSFGGNVRTPFHQDFVFFRPTVLIKKAGAEEFLLREGVLQIEKER